MDYISKKVAAYGQFVLVKLTTATKFILSAFVDTLHKNVICLIYLFSSQ